jgi:hypothetical protein
MTNAVSVLQKQPSTMALSGIRKGKIEMPCRVLLYGAEGVGKTTWCAGAPKPILLGADSGSSNINVDRLPEPKSWADILSGIDLVGNEKHEYKTIIVDPLNWCEALVFQDITGGTVPIEEALGGYGKGYTAALDKWRLMLAGLERCWKNGMHILLTAHSLVRDFRNPEGPSFDRYEVAMNAKAAGLFKQWVDVVLFAQIETFVKPDKPKSKRTIGTSGARIVHTQGCAAYDAKSRLKLPEEMDLSWSTFWSEVQAEKGRAGELAAQIQNMAEEIADPKVAEFSALWISKHAGDADRLAELANRLSLKMEESRKETT